MLKSLFEKLKEAAISVIPVTLIVLLLNFTPFVSFTLTETVVFSCCALALIIGMALFNLGAGWFERAVEVHQDPVLRRRAADFLVPVDDPLVLP